jgi:hypothetical protein
MAELKEKITWTKAADQLYPREYERQLAPLLRRFADFTQLTPNLISEVRANHVRSDSKEEFPASVTLLISFSGGTFELELPKEIRPTLIGIVNVCHPGHAFFGFPRDERVLFPRSPHHKDPMPAHRIKRLIISAGGRVIDSIEDERFRSVYRRRYGDPTPYRVSAPPLPSSGDPYPEKPDEQDEQGEDNEGESASDRT